MFWGVGRKFEILRRTHAQGAHKAHDLTMNWTTWLALLLCALAISRTGFHASSSKLSSCHKDPYFSVGWSDDQEVMTGIVSYTIWISMQEKRSVLLDCWTKTRRKEVRLSVSEEEGEEDCCNTLAFFWNHLQMPLRELWALNVFNELRTKASANIARLFLFLF